MKKKKKKGLVSIVVYYKSKGKMLLALQKRHR